MRALAGLAFDELRSAVGGLHGFHRAIADRAFRASGPAAAPAQALHDAISKEVYGGLAGAARLIGAAADASSAAAAWPTGGRCPPPRAAPWWSAPSPG